MIIKNELSALEWNETSDLVETGTQKRETKAKRDLMKNFVDWRPQERTKLKEEEQNQSERDFTRDLQNPKKRALSK